jgi:hypothetical protein
MTMTEDYHVPYLPIDAEARGKLRAWRRAASERYQRLDATVGTKEFANIGEAFATKKGVGRDRAWTRLKNKLGAHGARLQWCHQGDKIHYAIWAVLRPGQSLTLPEDHVRPDLTQDSVCVEYLLIGGDKKRAKLGRGLWSLEVPDHALHRLAQRDRKADIGEVILEAHNAALWMPYDDIDTNPLRGFNLPAGDGVFLAKLYMADAHPEDQVDDMLVAVRPWTWLHRDQLTDDQEKRMARRAVNGQRSLGDTLLLPHPFTYKDD